MREGELLICCCQRHPFLLCARDRGESVFCSEFGATCQWSTVQDAQQGGREAAGWPPHPPPGAAWSLQILITPVVTAKPDMPSTETGHCGPDVRPV